MNKVILVGYVGKDPEIKDINNKKLAKFSLATSEWGGGEKRTEWHNINAWGKTAEICSKYVRKGTLLAIIGRINTRTWERDGQRRYMTEIITDRVELLGRNEQREDEANTEPSTEGDEPVDNDLPF